MKQIRVSNMVVPIVNLKTCSEKERKDSKALPNSWKLRVWWRCYASRESPNTRSPSFSAVWYPSRVVTYYSVTHTWAAIYISGHPTSYYPSDVCVLSTFYGAIWWQDIFVAQWWVIYTRAVLLFLSRISFISFGNGVWYEKKTSARDLTLKGSMKLS